MALLPRTDPRLDLDDDGRPKRTGNVWTACAHVITGVIGSGVLSLAWSMAQMGWVAGPIVIVVFAYITYYTAAWLADCYRFPHPVTGKRSYRYKDAVEASLGRTHAFWCAAVQYGNLVATAIGYTITGAMSMIAIARDDCFHAKGRNASCGVPGNLYMIIFGLSQLVFSQIPNLDKLWWLSTVATVMSSIYSGIVLVLGIIKLAGNGRISGTATGLSLTQAQKTWAVFQSLGNVAFAFSFSMILIEIQDTLKSPPAENKTMKRATLYGIIATTTFYLSIGCVNYAAFGDEAPGNLLTHGFFNPYWLINFANACIVVHLVGAYQVYSQPVFQSLEAWAEQKWPKTSLTRTRTVFNGSYSFTLLRLVWRSLYVVAVTVVAMVIPFFNDVLGLLGALGFWPLTVYFPVEMYIRQQQIPRWSRRWIVMQSVSTICLLVSVAAAVGSVEGIWTDLKAYAPFHYSY